LTKSQRKKKGNVSREGKRKNPASTGKMTLILRNKNQDGKGKKRRFLALNFVEVDIEEGEKSKLSKKRREKERGDGRIPEKKLTYEGG